MAESVADDEWMKIYNANVMSHLWLIQAAKKDLVANKGSFIITGSIAGSQTSGSSLAYCEYGEEHRCGVRFQATR